MVASLCLFLDLAVFVVGGSHRHHQLVCRPTPILQPPVTRATEPPNADENPLKIRPNKPIAAPIFLRFRPSSPPVRVTDTRSGFPTSRRIKPSQSIIRSTSVGCSSELQAFRQDFWHFRFDANQRLRRLSQVTGRRSKFEWYQSTLEFEMLGVVESWDRVQSMRCHESTVIARN